MVAETVFPITKDMQSNEKRRLINMLLEDLESEPKQTNKELRAHLIKLCFKKKK